MMATNSGLAVLYSELARAKNFKFLLSIVEEIGRAGKAAVTGSVVRTIIGRSGRSNARS